MWSDILQRINSPLLDGGREAFDAAQPFAAEFLAQFLRHTDSGRIKPRGRNPFDYKLSGSFPGLYQFDTWTDLVREWRARNSPSEMTAADLKVTALLVEQAALWAQERSPGSQLPGDAERLPHEATADELTLWFGSLRRFTPGAPISELWRSYGRTTGCFPALLRVTGESNRAIYHFEGGLRLCWDGTVAQAMTA